MHEEGPLRARSDRRRANRTLTAEDVGWLVAHLRVMVAATPLSGRAAE